jgi:hypothetical protein
MLNVIYLYFWRVCGHARGHVLPADSGRGQILLPVADSGHGRGHENTVTGADLRYMYPRGFYPLPFVAPFGPANNEEKEDVYPDPRGCLMIFGRLMAYESRRQ